MFQRECRVNRSTSCNPVSSTSTEYIDYHSIYLNFSVQLMCVYNAKLKSLRNLSFHFLEHISLLSATYWGWKATIPCFLYQIRVEQYLYFVLVHYTDGNYKHWLLSLGELLYCHMHLAVQFFLRLVILFVHLCITGTYLADIIKTHPFLICLECCSYTVPTFLSELNDF